MSKPSFRIRLSGLEVTCRDGTKTVVPWQLVRQVQGTVNLRGARRGGPTLPGAIGLTPAQSRVMGHLRQRAIRRRLREGQLDVQWSAPCASFDVLMHALVALMIISPFAPILCTYSTESAAAESAIRRELSPGFWIAVVLLLLMIAIPFVFCVFRIASAVYRRLSARRPRTIRATSEGLTVTFRDGHETVYKWACLTNVNTDVLEFDGSTRVCVGLGTSGPPELPVLLRVLDPDRKRRLHKHGELWVVLRPLVPRLFWFWIGLSLVGVVAKVAAESNTDRVLRVAGGTLLISFAIAPILLLPLLQAFIEFRLEHRSRRRGRLARSQPVPACPRLAVR